MEEEEVEVAERKWRWRRMEERKWRRMEERKWRRMEERKWRRRGEEVDEEVEEVKRKWRRRGSGAGGGEEKG